MSLTPDEVNIEPVSLTPDEVNVECALDEGWKYKPTRPNDDLPWGKPRSDGKGFDWVSAPPDTCHDWKYAGPKLEELFKIGESHIDAEVMLEEILLAREEFDCGLREAISRVWLP